MASPRLESAVTAAEPVPADDIESLVRLAGATARAAGEVLREGLGHAHRSVETKSSPTDQVTDTDRRAEELITEHLLAARPQDGFLGEEGASVAGTSGITWIVDPLDGTTNFLYAVPGFAVSIAAVSTADPSQVLAGAVYDPCHDELFQAGSIGPAHRNDTPISCTSQQDLATSLVATGFSYDAERRRQQAVTLGEVVGQVRDIRRVGSAALDLCWVACGRLDAYYERGVQRWDVAAGSLIAARAGATVSTHDGYDGLLIMSAAPGIWRAFAELLTATGA